MTSNVKLVTAAMALRSEAPEAWQQFLFALREAAAAQTIEVVKCPPEMLLKAQGMAVIMNDLATTLMNAPQLYEKMRNNG